MTELARLWQEWHAAMADAVGCTVRSLDDDELVGLVVADDAFSTVGWVRVRWTGRRGADLVDVRRIEAVAWQQRLL